MYATSIKKTKPINVQLEGERGATVRYLLPAEAGVNYEMRYWELEPKGHTRWSQHSWEHEVFIVKGRGVVVSGGKKIKVKPGDAFFIPGNELHKLWNDSDTDPFGFICMVPKGSEDHLRTDLKERLEEARKRKD